MTEDQKKIIELTGRLENMGVKQREIAIATGYKNQSSIAQLRAGQSVPVGFIERLEAFYEIKRKELLKKLGE